ncbi:hypothetical protein D3C72_2069930 [compost metagenome]
MGIVLEMQLRRQRREGREHFPLGFEGIDNRQVDRKERNNRPDGKEQSNEQRSTFSESHASTSFLFMTPIWIKVKSRIIMNRITDLALAYP